MTARSARPHGQHPVEQHHAAVGPRGQVAVARWREAEIGPELLEDVLQAARYGAHVRSDRERKPDRMAWAWIGILTHDEHPNRFEGLGERP
jgi:hypothetical protein